MPKLFKFLKSERGVIHLIPLFLLLAGIIAGIYLVQHPQIFKPKATSQNVEFLPGECLTTQDGFGVLKCPNIQIKFTSPIDTGTTSDAGFSLVKTAYAYHEGGTEDYYCYGGDGVSDMSVGHSEKEPYGHNNFWDSCYKKNQICVWLDEDKRGKSEDGTPFKNDAECVDRPICQNGRWISRDSKGGIHDFGKCDNPAQCTTNTDCVDGDPCTTDLCLGSGSPGSLCIHNTLSEGTVCQRDGTTFQPVKYCNSNGKCELNEPLPKTCTNDIGCTDGNACTEDKCEDSKCVNSNKPAGTVCQYSSTTYQPVKYCSDVGKCDVEKLTAPPPTSQPRATAVPAPQSPSSTPLGGNGNGAPGCKNDGPPGNITPAQAKCVLGKRTDILLFYQKNNWCGDESNYPTIVNNWMSINSQGEKDQVKSCFEGAGDNVTKTTTRFRFAEDPADLAKAEWMPYTKGGVTKDHIFKDPNADGRSRFIYAEFEVKDSQGNISTLQAVPFPTAIKFIKTETQPADPSGTCPVTASCCAQNLQKCGPGVAGSKFDGVSKDTACPTGYQWCYSGYCINEKYDGKGTTGSCGGTTAGGGNTGGPLIANCEVVSRTTLPVNQPVTYHAFAAGGAGNYKYYWAGDLGNSSSSNSELVKTYTTTGYKTGSVIVYSGNDSKNALCPAVNVVGEDSSELSCQKDCKKCTAIKTCGYETYDSCVDDKGNSKTSTKFCQNGATKFRCYANANYNCASNEKPNVYDYLCSACIDTGSSSE